MRLATATATATTTTATAFDFAFWVRSPDWTGGKGSHLVPRTDSSLCSWCMQLASSVCLFTQRAPRAAASAASAPAAFWTTCQIQRGSPNRSSRSCSVGSVEPHHQLRPNSLAQLAAYSRRRQADSNYKALGTYPDTVRLKKSAQGLAEGIVEYRKKKQHSEEHWRLIQCAFPAACDVGCHKSRWTTRSLILNELALV